MDHPWSSALGPTMQDIVNSVQRVGSIIEEITVASREQASSIAETSRSISNMDSTTQQNAALVEEAAAAASSLEQQADELVKAVSSFKLGAGDSVVKTTVRSAAPMSTPFKGGERRTFATSQPKAKPAPAKASAAKPASLPKPVATAKATPSGGDDDWETF